MIPETEAALQRAMSDNGVTESYWLYLPRLKVNPTRTFGRRICAWCGKDMGPYEGEGDTHGICQDCFKKELSQ